jgi:hypothetical protein
MKSHLIIVASLVIVVVGAVVPAFAGSGDPRLVNGVLEWPRALSNEPFLVVRGDDGVLYYVAIAAARRDGTLTTGTRVVVLGLEGRTSHEITALGIGTGESTEAALANLQGARSAAAPSANAVVAPPAAPAAATPTGTASSPTVTAAPPAVTPSTATVVTPSTPTVVTTTPPTVVTTTPPSSVTPLGATPAPAASAPTPPPNGGAAAIAAPSSRPTAPTPSASSAPTAPAVTPPASTVTPRAPLVTPPNGIAGQNIISAPIPSATRSAAVAPPARTIVTPGPVAMPTSATEDRRWMEISGVVESLSGRTLVIRTDDGRVAVDVSSLSINLDRMVAPGSTVRVYGVPVELRFKAMGFVDAGPRP